MLDRFKKILLLTVLWGLLLLPVACALFTAVDLEYSCIKKIVYLLVVLTGLFLPTLIFKARTYFIFEGVFNFLFFPIDIASLILNKQPTSVSFLDNIYNTNLEECFELLSSIWYIVIITILLWGLYFFLALRVDNVRLVGKKLAYVFLSGAGVLLLSGMLTMKTVLNHIHSDEATDSSFWDVFELVWIKLYKIYPYNLYLETIDIIKTHQEQKELAKQVESFRFGLSPSQNDSSVLYVLIIGETARYDHFGVNGYERNTTPNLVQKRNLITFDSVFSQGNLTLKSVPFLISRATALEPNLIYSEKSLPEAFQEAGFSTAWITKQIPFPFVKRIMKSCDYSYFYSKGMDVDANYDADMIDKMREFEKDTAQFVVLHSLGSHFKYALRYPKSFDYFQPAFGRELAYMMIAEENKDKIINAYDNSILYTDYFLNELINYVDSLNRVAVVVFISDHGESFWDDERKLSLHGSYQVSEYEYHVPLFVWYSDEYKTKYPEKVAAMALNKSKLISSNVIFYSLLDIAGIRGVTIDSKSICSPLLEVQDTIQVFTGAGTVVPWTFRTSYTN